MTDRDTITRTRARASGAEAHAPSRRCTIESSGPTQCGTNVAINEMHEGRRQTSRKSAYAGSRLSFRMAGFPGTAGRLACLSQLACEGTERELIEKELMGN